MNACEFCGTVDQHSHLCVEIKRLRAEVEHRRAQNEQMEKDLHRMRLQLAEASERELEQLRRFEKDREWKAALVFQIRAKDETIRKLREALTIRRAMEPKHSDLEHDCPECELVAEIIHSEQMENQNHECTCSIDGTPYCKAKGTGYCLVENPERLHG